MIFRNWDPEQPAADMWDQEILKQLFDEDNVVVIPGAYQANYIGQINQYLAGLPYCVVIISSDEEGKFPVDQLNHPNMKVYRQYLPADRQIPVGSPRNMKKKDKNIPIFYAGQVNSEERLLLWNALQELKGTFLRTDGFSQGFPREEYRDLMGRAMVVPCPAGWISPDSFRLYEALEAGCTPVIHSKHAAYFRNLLGDFPFPTVDNWVQLKDVEYHDYLDWWNIEKKSLARRLREDLQWLKSQS